MMKPALLLIVLVLLITGCVTTTPEALFTPVTVPPGNARNTGSFPAIGEQRQGQTVQISPLEAAAERKSVANSAKRGAAQAAQDNEAAYKAEVAALQKLAQDQKKRRLADIESRKF